MTAQRSRRAFLSFRGGGKKNTDRNVCATGKHLCVSRRAMACTFSLLFPAQYRRAVEAGCAALDEIERLESKLSAYRTASDVSYMNRNAGQAPVVVDDELFTLCHRAARISEETGGAYDITTGALTKAWGFFRGSKRVPSQGELEAALAASGVAQVELDSVKRTVRYHHPGLEINLGSIGKGYAIDRAAELLQEWEINRALIHGGFSSVLALDAPPGHEGWPLTISLPGGAQALERIVARRQAWSASGIRKKDHILDPRTGLPVRNRPAAWVSGSLEALNAAYHREDATEPSGVFETGISPSAVAEALSTAFMIMSCDEIADCCLRHPGVEGRILVSDPSDASASPVLVHFTHR